VATLRSMAAGRVYPEFTVIGLRGLFKVWANFTQLYTRDINITLGDLLVLNLY